MIEELTTYISGIQEQFPLHEFVEGPTQGLHIMLEVQDGNVEVSEYELYKPKKGEEDNYSDFLRQECMPKEMHIDYIKSHKALIGKEGKKIHSAVPFALKIRKKSFDEEWIKWFPKKGITKEEKELISNYKKAIKENESKLKNLKGEEKKELLAAIVSKKNELIAKYFGELIQRYFERANNICSPEYQDKDDFEDVLVFQEYCIERLPDLLSSLSKEIIQLSKNDDIIVLMKNVSKELYKEANSNYIKDYVFNVDYFNQKIGQKTYGLSGYLNTASDKKPYLKHLTAPFDINYRIPQQKALLLNTFKRYVKEGAFKTNPLPIFIDRVELNKVVVNAVKTKGKQINFREIIRVLFKDKQDDLGNYYLFYFWGGYLKDLDFVSSFSYSLNVRLREVIPKAEPNKGAPIKNIFQFESKILQPIFNNLLIQKRKNGTTSYRYFDEIDNNPKYNTATTWNLVMKYRKAFYDFIYKSRRQAVTNAMFHNIMEETILDDMRHDEIKVGKDGKKYNTKTTDICRKLNIWFSLWNYFGKEKTTNDLTIMATKIEQHQERMRIIRDSKSNGHLKSDDEFAFAVGQVAYFLLSLSKAGNKTHALLEPFLQKTNIQELKKTLGNTFRAYNHEISFYKGRFDKLFSEVMDYELDGNLKELLPYLLAGYFSNSVIYENNNPKTSEQ